MLRLVLTKHKCLTVFTGGSGHGHGTKAVFCAVQNVLHNAVHNWTVFYASGGMVSRLNFQRVPKRVLFENGFLKIIRVIAFQPLRIVSRKSLFHPACKRLA